MLREIKSGRVLVRVFVLLFILLTVACNSESDFKLDFDAKNSDGYYLTTDDMNAKFTTEQNMAINNLCDALARKASREIKTLKFQTTRLECNGKEVNENVSVKNEHNGVHHYFEADKTFPFYQDQTIDEGVIKDLCNQRTGQKLIAMSNHGGSVRYLFNLLSCEKDHFCLEAGTVVQDYRNKKFKLVRKELFEVNSSGDIINRELAYMCKDKKRVYRYTAQLKI